MKLKWILFDLDGTLLPMDQDVFVKAYFKQLAKRLAPFGYEPEKLVKTIWAGTGAMVVNDGHAKNIDVFWDAFAGIYGEESRGIKPEVDAFYSNEFCKAQESCGFNPEAKKAVEAIKAMGYSVALATNPIFPAVATRRRIDWAGLTPEDFAIYTTYENSCHCKPNPEYYKDVCAAIGANPEECLMVGNDVGEDMIPAEGLGMKVFLLTDCLINKDGVDISRYPNGSFAELLAYVKDESK